jgi:DNA-binding transcriptional ArsR family regulator
MSATELPVRQRGRSRDIELPGDRGWAGDTVELLRALADPTRLSMVWCLRQAPGPVCICDFKARFHLGQPTISHHMGRLRAAGLVESQKRGIWIYYRLRQDLPPATARLLESVLASAGERLSPRSG